LGGGETAGVSLFKRKMFDAMYNWGTGGKGHWVG